MEVNTQTVMLPQISKSEEVLLEDRAILGIFEYAVSCYTHW